MADTIFIQLPLSYLMAVEGPGSSSEVSCGGGRLFLCAGGHCWTDTGLVGVGDLTPSSRYIYRLKQTSPKGRRTAKT